MGRVRRTTSFRRMQGRNSTWTDLCHPLTIFAEATLSIKLHIYASSLQLSTQRSLSTGTHLIPWWRWNHFDNKLLSHCCSYLVRSLDVPILSTAGMTRRGFGCVAHYGKISLALNKSQISLRACAIFALDLHNIDSLFLITGSAKINDVSTLIFRYVSLRYIYGIGFLTVERWPAENILQRVW